MNRRSLDLPQQEDEKADYKRMKANVMEEVKQYIQTGVSEPY